MAGDLVASGAWPADAQAELISTLAEIHTDRDPHAGYFETAFHDAIRQSFAEQTGATSALGELAESLARDWFTKLTRSIDIQSFVSLARTLGVEHPDLDQLDRMVR